MLGKRTARWRDFIVSTLRAVAMLSVCFAIIAIPIVETARDRQSAEQAFSESIKTAETALDSLNAATSAARPVVEDITTSCGDAALCSDAQAALSDADEVAQTSTVEEKSGGPTDALVEATDHNEQIASEADTAQKILKTSVDAMVQGYTDSLEAQIDDALSSAQSIYDASAGWIGDDERASLATAIEKASTEGMDYTALRDALSELESESESVNRATEEAKEEAAAMEAARAASSRSGNGSSSSQSGAWHVSYIWGAQAEIDTGAVVQWKSGYFCAHNWSSGGKRIAAKPAYVVVDGITYRYVSSINVARDTKYSEVEGFAHANGGIAFQTCSGNTYLITHYEPV